MVDIFKRHVDRKEVDGFIKRFNIEDAASAVFANGCCFWFAYILYGRFLEEDPEIMYDVSENHFGTRIIGRVFDVTGDVTDQYDWEPWDTYDDDAHKDRIVRDCVMF